MKVKCIKHAQTIILSSKHIFRENILNARNEPLLQKTHIFLPNGAVGGSHEVSWLLFSSLIIVAQIEVIRTLNLYASAVQVAITSTSEIRERYRFRENQARDLSAVWIEIKIENG